MKRAPRVTSVRPSEDTWTSKLRNNGVAWDLTWWFSVPRRSPGFVIVTYHRVLERPDPYYHWGLQLSTFEAQLRLFKRFCAVLSLDEIVTRIERGQALPRRCVALTFDDGYRDVYTLAWPVLQRYRLPATLFVAVQAIEQGFLWFDGLQHAIRRTKAVHVAVETLGDGGVRTFGLGSESARVRAVRQLNAYMKRLRPHEQARVFEELARKLHNVSPEAAAVDRVMLSWEELQALASDGMEIGTHSMTHVILTRLSEEEARDEIVQSRQILERRLSRPVDHFSYPNGQPPDFSPGIQRLIAEARCRSASTTIRGVNQPSENRFALKRIDGAQIVLRALAGPRYFY